MIQFWKYHGAGNDFIMIDQRQEQWLTPANKSTIARLCDRHFGIGADGLILLEPSTTPGCDFSMVYFNADGGESTLCGNGGRCIAAFALHRGAVSGDCRFMAIDGQHEVHFGPSTTSGIEWVELHMGDVSTVKNLSDANAYYLNTGSPHYVRFLPDIQDIDLMTEGKAVRYHADYAAQGGTNANFATIQNNGVVALRTYERGVEGETLACGTGATAAAIAYAVHAALPDGNYEVPVQAVGAMLRVRFKRMAAGFTDIWLCGPAQRVFEGLVPPIP
jgi:diaminopimelate epimerase